MFILQEGIKVTKKIKLQHYSMSKIGFMKWAVVDSSGNLTHVIRRNKWGALNSLSEINRMIRIRESEMNLTLQNSDD